jgi:endonuclease YncB( thermonuclease family)
VLASLLLVALLLSAAPAAAGQPPALVGQIFDATVVRIADGDSLEIVRDGHRERLRVRLEGVDAPETGEVFSRDAEALLRRLVLDRRVRVSGRDIDRYGRLVARVAVDGRDASLELVTAGLACQRFAADAVLAAAEARARAGGAGFWAASAAKPQCVARSARPISPATPRGAPRPAPRQTPSPSASTEVRANVSSGLYHRAWCPNFTCRNCTRRFASEREAQAAGFKPAGDCVAR